MQMIIWRNQPLANDHLEGPSSCKRSSGGKSLLQKNIGRDRPLANDHLEGPASPTSCYIPPTSSQKIHFPEPNIFFLFLLRFSPYPTCTGDRRRQCRLRLSPTGRRGNTPCRGCCPCGRCAEIYFPAGINQGLVAASIVPPVVCLLPW